LNRTPEARAQELDLHNRRDPHRSESSLSDVILGGQDGLVNVLGVLLGVAAATSDADVVIVAGLATAFSESISMAAVAYTSTQADADLYESELAREHRHVRTVPDLERDEVRAIFQRKGYSGERLEDLVDAVTADKDVWVALMLAVEHRLVPIDRRAARRSAWVVGASALVGSLLPVAPFLLLSVSTAMIAAVGVAALVLFGVGYYKAKVTVGRPLRSAVELAVIGTLSALVGYVVGALFEGLRGS
jgi:predicted membrane protein (TIGR00267 family)